MSLSARIKGKCLRRGDLKVWLKYGHVMINGIVTTNVKTPVMPGDWVELNQTRPFVVFRHPRMQIVYEDDDIIVVNKGYGLLSVGTGSAKRGDGLRSPQRIRQKEAPGK